MWALRGLALCSLSASLLPAQLADKKTLTLDRAKKVAAAAEIAAVGNKWSMVIVVLDDGGNLLFLERMNGAPLGYRPPKAK